MDPARLLSTLCELEPPTICLDALESETFEAAETLLRLGFLVESKRAGQVVCPACDQLHWIGVKQAPDQSLRGYCRETGWQGIEPAATFLHRVDEVAIANHFRRCIGLREVRAEDVEASASHIGLAKFPPFRVHLFFARRLGDPHRRSLAWSEVERLKGKDAAVVISCADLVDLPGLPRRTGAVALHEVLLIEGETARVNDGPIYSVLREPKAWPGKIGWCASPGFRSVDWNDRQFSFSRKQAEVVELLHSAWFEGTGRVHQQEIGGITTQRMTELFGKHPAYGTLIQNDNGGYYWLDI